MSGGTHSTQIGE